MGITLIDDSSTFDLPGNGLAVDASVVEASLGWALKPEGLCRDEVCVPMRDEVRHRLVRGADIDIGVLGEALGRMVAADPDRSIAAWGVPGAARAAEMQALAAPDDVTLHDLDGNAVALSDFAQRKRLILAWSSW